MVEKAVGQRHMLLLRTPIVTETVDHGPCGSDCPGRSKYQGQRCSSLQGMQQSEETAASHRMGGIPETGSTASIRMTIELMMLMNCSITCVYGSVMNDNEKIHPLIAM